ncbi:MAG: hypothetical protein F2832_08600 [Actinobacteria bacterium]|nr:hypothetical protein [Actinomycetota bacterium]
MAVFFIDTSTGQVATRRQLLAEGVATPREEPQRPWLRIRGTDDATTLWYAVLRREEKGIFIGSLVLRHSSHHALLVERGWEEVDVEELRARDGVPQGDQEM